MAVQTGSEGGHGYQNARTYHIEGRVFWADLNKETLVSDWNKLVLVDLTYYFSTKDDYFAHE